MAVNQPDLTGDTGGFKSGVAGGAATPTTSTTTAANPNAPQKLLQQRWRPPSFLDFHMKMQTQPAQVSRDLDASIQRAFQNDSTLESMIASTQFGQTKVTGKSLAIPTGLTTVRQAVGTIDNGSTAHNFWVTCTLSQTPGCIDIYIFQPTAAGNTTPIPATTAVTVRWAATGSL